MKRRHFLATAGTVGIATTVAGGSVASSAYASINATVLLQEFQPEVKTIYSRFATELEVNTKDLVGWTVSTFLVRFFLLVLSVKSRNALFTRISQDNTFPCLL